MPSHLQFALQQLFIVLKGFVLKNSAPLLISIAATLSLTACAGADINGDYTGTVNEEGITAQMDLTIADDVCQFSMTVPIVGEMPYSCEIDQSNNVIVLDGEEINYTVDGDSIVMETLEDEEDVVLKKVSE